MEGHSCKRKVRICETLLETIHLVTPTHINPLGVAHGGNVLKWMITAGSMAAMRLSRGPALLARMDNVFFINPLRLGMNAVVTAWVEYVGRSSMEVTILVEEEDPRTGTRRITTAAHTTYVRVGEDLRPRPVEACIVPRGPQEEELYKRAEERRQHRSRKPPVSRELKPIVPGYSLENTRLVNPEDTIAYNAMHAGRLLYLMDETAGILAMKYARGVTVTAAVDATDFVSPILVGDIVRINAALTYLGRTSLEVGMTVETYNPITGESRRNASSYFTMVHLSPEGRPAPIPKPSQSEAWRGEYALEAEERRRRRLELLRFFRQEADKIKPPKCIE
ncbi:MAG: acyl-CoA thioesterase [Desulfurococcales archaeon]|nr:acyl-CoA thioesterase [Desulfurococcales archaeon]